MENLKQQIRRDINQVTFGKFVTSLVQKLKILGVYKIVNQGTDYKSKFLSNILKFLDQQCYKFSVPK